MRLFPILALFGSFAVVGDGGFHTGAVCVMPESEVFSTHFAGVFIYMRRAEDEQVYLQCGQRRRDCRIIRFQ